MQCEYFTPTGVFCKATYRQAERYVSASTTVRSPLALSDYFLDPNLHFWTHKDGLYTKLSLAYITRLSTVACTIHLYLEAVYGHHYHNTGHVVYASKQVVIVTFFTNRIYITVFAYNLSILAFLTTVYIEAAIFQ